MWDHGGTRLGLTIGQVQQWMERGALSLVSGGKVWSFFFFKRLTIIEHTLLVTDDGVEVLTARFPNSPGGPPTVEQVKAAGLDPSVLTATTTI